MMRKTRKKMEYPALGTVEAADSGGARPYNISEEREGREPDGLRFDRERARRLWEAVSGAQPVGREEGESEGLKRQEAPNPPAPFAGSSGSAGRERGPAPGSTVTPPNSRPAHLRDAPGDSGMRAPHRAQAPWASSPQNRVRGTPRIRAPRANDQGPSEAPAAGAFSPAFSPTRAQLFPNSWTVIPLHAFWETHRLVTPLTISP